MSKFEIKMPKLGESITEGTIVSWSVKVDDMIQEDDVLFEVNTAKVSAEIPSPVAGKVVEILYKEGDTVAVGTVVAIIDLDGEESSGTEPVSEGVVREEADAGQVAANVSETSPSSPSPIIKTQVKRAELVRIVIFNKKGIWHTNSLLVTV